MKKRFLKDFFSFTRGEQQSIMVLAALLLVLIALPLVIRHCATQKAPSEVERLRQLANRLGEAAPPQYDQLADTKTYGGGRKKAEQPAFTFDPNTIGRDSLLLLGFSPKQTDAILKYRGRGSGFRSAADFFKLGVITDRQRERLQAYALVAPRADAKSFVRDTLARKTYTPRPPVELNSADTAMLNALPGIGAYLSQRIVEYREQLGGYASLEQLLEIRYFDAEKLQRLAPRLTLDTQQLRQLELIPENLDLMRRHPYIGAYAARGIAQLAKRKGGPATLDELVQNNILTADKAEKLKPYVK